MIPFFRRSSGILCCRVSLQKQIVQYTTTQAVSASSSHPSTDISTSTSQPGDHLDPSTRLSDRNEEHKAKSNPPSPPRSPRKKTMVELDEELRLKMEGISGDGGSSGVEYENGKAEGLKRGVKANMFRVIWVTTNLDGLHKIQKRESWYE